MAGGGPFHTVLAAIVRVEEHQVKCFDRFRQYIFGGDVVVVDTGDIESAQVVGLPMGTDLRAIFNSNGAKLLLQANANGGFDVVRAQPAELSLVDARLLGLHNNGY